MYIHEFLVQKKALQAILDIVIENIVQVYVGLFLETHKQLQRVSSWLSNVANLYCSAIQPKVSTRANDKVDRLWNYGDNPLATHYQYCPLELEQFLPKCTTKYGIKVSDNTSCWNARKMKNVTYEDLI